MPNINLLPWREQRRAELKREFLLVLGASAVVGALIVLALHFLFMTRLQHQQHRNNYLSASIETLDRQVVEILGLQQKRAQLLQRMQVIQALQGNRPVIVRILDQLVRTLPEGVFYTELEADHRVIQLTGVAQDHQQVASLMRRLEASDWFRVPNLEGMKAEPDYGEQAAVFTMTVRLEHASGGEG